LFARKGRGGHQSRQRTAEAPPAFSRTPSQTPPAHDELNGTKLQQQRGCILSTPRPQASGSNFHTTTAFGLCFLMHTPAARRIPRLRCCPAWCSGTTAAARPSTAHTCTGSSWWAGGGEQNGLLVVIGVVCKGVQGVRCGRMSLTLFCCAR